MAMIKLFSVGQDEEAGGFPVLDVLSYENGRATSSLMKMASARRYISPDVQDFIEGLTTRFSGMSPQEKRAEMDKVYMFVSALGCVEDWGPNRRHDGFTKEGLFHQGDDYGFRTFTKAHTFVGHKNHSPDLAIGKVVFASANPRMGRVEIVKYAQRSKAPEICARIDKGELVQTSMGARVPYDICSVPVCHNVAKTAAEHCPHIKESAGQEVGDGILIYMVNDQPRFFDDSVVKVGAARESGMLRKVASHDESARLGELYFGKESEEDKDAYLRKRIDLVSRPAAGHAEDPVGLLDRVDDLAETRSFAPYIPALLDTEPVLPEKTLQKASGYPIAKLASTFAVMGIPLRPEEFQYVVLQKAGFGKEASILYRASLLLGAPAPVDQDVRTAEQVHYADVDQKLAEDLQPHLPLRSVWEPHLSDRIDHLASLPDWKLAELRTSSRVLPDAKLPWSTPEVMAALALGYGLYRKSSGPGATAGLLESSLRAHPWLAPVLLLAGSWGIRGLGGTIAGQDRPVKVGGALGSAAGFLLPVGGAYLLSASAMRKEREGYPLGAMERLIRHYPLPIGVAGALAAGKVRGKLKSVTKAVERGAKTASSAGDAALYTALGWYSPYRFPAALLDSYVLDRIFDESPKTRKPEPKSGVGLPRQARGVPTLEGGSHE